MRNIREVLNKKPASDSEEADLALLEQFGDEPPFEQGMKFSADLTSEREAAEKEVTGKKGDEEEPVVPPIPLHRQHSVGSISAAAGFAANASSPETGAADADALDHHHTAPGRTQRHGWPGAAGRPKPAWCGRKRGGRHH